jgi:hypothetical protein
VWIRRLSDASVEAGQKVISGGESACTPDSVRGVSLTSPNAWKRLLSSHFVCRWLSLFVVVAQRPED